MPGRAVLALVLAALASPAAAHIQLAYPPARSGTAALPDFVNQKVRPCGVAGRSTIVTHLDPGATITVLFDEIIDHPGEFRVAFDPNGDDDLAPPVWDGTTWNTPPGVRLLAEHVPDLPAGVTRGEVQVTLPAIDCASCTLQLVMIMTDKPPFTGDDDFYFMCADLVLGNPPVCGNGVVEGFEDCDDGNTVDGDGCSRSCTIERASAPAVTPTPARMSSGGCASGGAGVASGAGAAAAALGIAIARARRHGRGDGARG